MPIIISYSERDMLRGKIVTPSWYVSKVEDISQSLSAKKDSTNYQVECTIVRDANNGSIEFAGVPFYVFFNSKAIGMSKPFMEAIVGEEVKVGERYDLEAAIGKELEIFVKNQVNDGKIRNQVDGDFRPVTK